MAIPVEQFQPETFAQANPFLTGFQMGNQAIQQALQTHYMQPMLQAQLGLAQARVPNMQAQTQDILQGRIPLEQAQAVAQRALPGLYGAEANQAMANAGLLGARTNLLRQTTPYEVEAAQGSIYKDPLMQRLFELGQAQQTGQISPQILNQMGLGASNSGGAPLAQNFNGGNPGVNPVNAPQMFGGNPAQNWALFGSTLNPLQMMRLQAMGAQMKENATSGVTQYNTAQANAAQEANIANQMSNLVDQFQNNYGKTSEKGIGLGRLPALSSAAQATDNASQNLAALYAKTIAGGRVTNYEMQYMSQLKPSRSMNPETAQMSSDFWKQKALRMQEEPSFLNAARERGISVQSAQALWNMYNNQRPVYNFQLQKPNTQFQQTWNDYLTPQAVNAVSSGQRYVPMPSFGSQSQFKAWFSTLPSGDQQTVMFELQGGQK